MRTVPGDATLVEMRLSLAARNLVSGVVLENESIADALEAAARKASSSEQVEALIRREVETAITETVKKSIESFFSYGEGRDAIEGIVKQALAPVVSAFSKKAAR